MEEAGYVLPEPRIPRREDDNLAGDGTDAGKSQPMEDERIETRWFTKKELRTMIVSNRIVDGKTMIAFLHWARL